MECVERSVPHPRVSSRVPCILSSPEVVRGAGEALQERLVSPAGLEPATHSLEGCCSVQLSYGEGNGRGERIRTSDPLLPKQVRYQTALHPDAVCGKAREHASGRTRFRYTA